MKSRVEIVDDERVDGIERQPLQRLRIGAHDPVIRIVKIDLEIQPAFPR
jgi:hypothetical protein